MVVEFDLPADALDKTNQFNLNGLRLRRRNGGAPRKSGRICCGGFLQG
jgi:hypothetical protein